MQVCICTLVEIIFVIGICVHYDYIAQILKRNVFMRQWETGQRVWIKKKCLNIFFVCALPLCFYLFVYVLVFCFFHHCFYSSPSVFGGRLLWKRFREIKPLNATLEFPVSDPLLFLFCNVRTEPLEQPARRLWWRSSWRARRSRWVTLACTPPDMWRSGLVELLSRLCFRVWEGKNLWWHFIHPSLLPTAVPLLQWRPLGGTDAAGAGPQAAEGRRPGSKHRRHGGVLPHPSGEHTHLKQLLLFKVRVNAAAPLVQVSPELLQQVRDSVLQKTVDGMREEGTPYVGKCNVISIPYLVKELMLGPGSEIYWSEVKIHVCCHTETIYSLRTFQNEKSSDRAV